MEQATVSRQDPLPAAVPPAAPAPARLVSLDAFRGAIIALMVLVNTPGDGATSYGPLNHADWNGWTITDVVFPSFLWIVGVAMTLSMAKRLAAGIPRSQIFLQVLRRAAILYALGLFLYGFPEFDLSHPAHPRSSAANRHLLRDRRSHLPDQCLRGQIVWIVSLLAAYWLIMTLVPVPGFGAGTLDVERNFAHYVDRHGPRITQLRAHQNLGPRGHRQHAPGDRHGALRHPGGPASFACAANWRSAPPGCSSRAICSSPPALSAISGCPSTRKSGPARSPSSWPAWIS